MDKERFSVFLLGLSVGVGVSLLVAPKSGRESRASIRDNVDEGTEYLRQRCAKVKQTAAAWVNKGKEALTRQKDSLTEAQESNKQAYCEAVS
jgi:gas vesicle protein